MPVGPGGAGVELAGLVSSHSLLLSVCVPVLRTLGRPGRPRVTRKWTWQVESSAAAPGTKVPPRQLPGHLPGGDTCDGEKAVRIRAAADPRHRDRPGLTSRGDDLAARLKGRRRAAHRRAAIERRYAAYLGEGRTFRALLTLTGKLGSRLVPGGSGVRAATRRIAGRWACRSTVTELASAVPLGAASGRDVLLAAKLHVLSSPPGFVPGRGWRNGGMSGGRAHQLSQLADGRMAANEGPAQAAGVASGCAPPRR